MAMITCPSCGKQISDKSQQCIHCGYVLAGETKKKCVECGAELDENATICHECGCPVESEFALIETEHPQQVKVTREKTKLRVHKKSFVIKVVAIVAIICTVFAVRAVQKQQAEEQAQKEKEAAIQLSEEYGENVETLSLTMLSGAADAEKYANLIQDVWYNSIYEISDSSTDRYTKKNGVFYDDFNDALNELSADSNFQSKIQKLKEHQSSVTSTMKEMKNPPKEWSDAYDDLKEYYNAYIQLTNIAIDPKGSYNTFTDDFHTADNNVSSCYEKMKLYFDE